MHDSLAVGVVERFGDDATQLGRGRKRRRADAHPLVQRNAKNQIAHDVNRVGVATDFVDRDDMPVAKLRGHAGFAHHLFDLERIQLPAARHLDGHVAVQFRVTGPPDGAERTFSQLVHQFEPPHAARHALGRARSDKMKALTTSLATHFLER